MNALSSIYGSAAGHHSGGFLASASGKIRSFLARWSEKRAHARELQDLYRFNDRELWDIGLSRSDFLSIESATYRRD